MLLFLHMCIFWTMHVS
uniref:Uncharacterized protein n=1 Tax=Oryza rufipogon TaxID=4529 RepID=A0A0E0RFR8_ORYRU